VEKYRVTLASNERAGLEQPARVDYEYEQQGVCCQLMMCEPLRGWRHVTVTDRRTRRDYAHCIRDLVDRHYPRATKIHLAQDNLNTHDGASLYETFQPEDARNARKARIHWMFTLAVTRQKLSKLYPSIED